MNATYNLDHVQAIAQATSLLNTVATPGDVPTVSKPKTATTSHYDPMGQQVATTSNTTYTGVTFAPDGTIAGGTLTHESWVPGGNKLSTTAVGFGTNGKPQSAAITVHNNSGDGDYKKIQMDLSGATWNNSLGISAGQVKLSSVHAATGLKLHDGIIQFNNETVASGAFTHYATDGSGAVKGITQVDYTGAKFLGTNIVGGQYTVHSNTPDNVLKSTSNITVSPLGRVQSIETTNLNLSSKVSVDFSKVVFNARNEFHSGEIGYTANDNNGVLLSQTSVAYNNANPSLSTTSVYKDTALQNKILIDYAASTFNNDHRVVNSTKKVGIYSGTGQLVTSAVVAYDALGNKVTGSAATAIINTAPSTTSAPPASTTPTSNFAMGVSPDPNDPGYSTKIDTINRPDGTREMVRQTSLMNGKPVETVLTLYAADGNTVVKRHTINLSGLTFDPTANTISGTLNMQSHTGDNILHAESSIQF